MTFNDNIYERIALAYESVVGPATYSPELLKQVAKARRIWLRETLAPAIYAAILNVPNTIIEEIAEIPCYDERDGEPFSAKWFKAQVLKLLEKRDLSPLVPMQPHHAQVLDIFHAGGLDPNYPFIEQGTDPARLPQGCRAYVLTPEEILTLREIYQAYRNVTNTGPMKIPVTHANR